MKLIALLIVITTCFSCVSNSNKDIEDKLTSLEQKLNDATKEKDPNRYYNEELNISVVSPKDWEIKENYQDIPVFFMSPIENEEDLFQENINMVNENAAGYSLQQYYDANLTGINEYLNDFKIIKEPVDVKINGHDFKKMVYEHNSQNYTFKVLIFFAVNKGKGYVINCTAETNTFNDYYNDFNKFAESFKFE